MQSRIRTLFALFAVLLFTLFIIGQQTPPADAHAACMKTCGAECCKDGSMGNCAEHCKKAGHTCTACNDTECKDHDQCAKSCMNHQHSDSTPSASNSTRN